MPRPEGMKYESPRGERLRDTKKGHGEPDCQNGITDTACKSGSNANPSCISGGAAYGCVDGSVVGAGTCNNGGNQT
jgi:hypothetical protein